MWDFKNLQSLDLNQNCVFDSPFETESIKEACMFEKCDKKAPDPQRRLHKNLNCNDNEKVSKSLFWYDIDLPL